LRFNPLNNEKGIVTILGNCLAKVLGVAKDSGFVTARIPAVLN